VKSMLWGGSTGEGAPARMVGGGSLGGKNGGHEWRGGMGMEKIKGIWET